MSDVILGALIALLGVILGQLIMFRLQKQSNEAAMARERLRIEAQDVSDSRELILDRLDDLLTAGDKAYRALVKGDDHKKASDMFYRAMRMADRLASVVPVFLMPAIKEYINVYDRAQISFIQTKIPICTGSDGVRSYEGHDRY